MLSYWYVCDVNPVPWQIGPIGTKRNPSGRTSAWMGRDEELFTYKEAIKESLRQQNPVMLEGELGITCYFWRNRTEATTPTGRKTKKSEADGTNMLKSTEDACQGILFQNDKSNRVGRFFVIEQGPDVVGRAIIVVEKLPGLWRDDVLKNLPDQIYAELFGSPTDKLAVGLSVSNSTLASDDEKYRDADPVF